MFQLRLTGQVLLRLLLAAAAIVAAVQAYRLLLLPGIVSLFDLGEATTSLLRRSGIFVCALSAYWVYVRYYEKRAATELRPAPIGIVVGAAIGAGLLLLATLVLFATGVYEVTEYRGLQSGLFGVAGFIVVAATLEELAYRAVLFRTLEQAWGTGIALVLQALLFGVGHLENLGEQPSTAEIVTTVVSVTLLGALWTLVFVYSRNLWVAAANHAAWNFSIILTGVPLSALGDWVSFAPIVSAYRGPDWLTGGVFGPEGSMITMVLVCAALVVAWRLARAKGRFVRARKREPAAAAPAALGENGRLRSIPQERAPSRSCDAT